MKKFAILALALVVASVALADRNIVVPDTSVARPEDAGKFAHTNHLIYVGPWTRLGDPEPLEAMRGPAVLPMFAGPSGLHPADVRSAYGLPSTGGAGAIAIVDAYDYPTAVNDFNFFSTTFGLPTETGDKSHFQVVYSGSKPKSNPGWALEAALDIEWAHAMAPNAKIYLVLATTNSLANLKAAEIKAKGLVGVQEVSNSWGSGEYSGELSDDATYTQNGVVFFASSGDSGGVKSYPAISPNVVGVGGTTLPANGNETAWSGSGCGLSSYEPVPSFQSFLGLSHRACADISAVADPNTGAAVYDTTRYSGHVGWWIVGGTSLACPMSAGITNLAGHNLASSNAELTYIYGHQSSFFDVLSGTAGSFSAHAGWDYPTGVGSPRGTTGL